MLIKLKQDFRNHFPSISGADDCQADVKCLKTQEPAKYLQALLKVNEQHLRRWYWWGNPQNIGSIFFPSHAKHDSRNFSKLRQWVCVHMCAWHGVCQRGHNRANKLMTKVNYRGRHAMTLIQSFLTSCLLARKIWKHAKHEEREKKERKMGKGNGK